MGAPMLVAAGGQRLRQPPRRIRRLASQLDPGGRGGPAPETLTRTERKVAALMIEGLENSEIARRLKISRYTVKKHVSQVLYKMAARNRTHAVVLLLKHRPAGLNGEPA